MTNQEFSDVSLKKGDSRQDRKIAESIEQQQHGV
jgi:hypothetical protein